MHTLLSFLLLLVCLEQFISWPGASAGDPAASEGGPGDSATVSPANSLVWGPGLETHIVLPVRYFFVQLRDDQNNNITTSVGDSPFMVELRAASGDRIRLHLQQLDRHDGSYIVRYKLYSSYQHLTMTLTYEGAHVASSPYRLLGHVYHEGCDCPVSNPDKWLKAMHCPASFPQIDRDLAAFSDIYMSRVVPEVWQRFNRSGSHSLCRYVIKDNQLYRSTMGKHVGFKMFSDAMLLSLLRKVTLPDMEFYINLGDWPLETRTASQNPLPIFSWCGSDSTLDIVMPTYDVTESTLETMGRVTLDLMSVQGNTPIPWADRLPQAFWRGRDSRQERLNLVKLSRRKPDLIDAKLTNMFFFKHDVNEVGELVKHTSFFDFFKYKYQINVDGTVAAYRFPYLMGGRSLILKQQSKYYEHFYKDLVPYEHYVPLRADLSDLEEQLQWAQDNDDKVQQIAAHARQYVNDHLLAENIFCYHVVLFRKYAERLKEVPEVQSDMEHVPQPEDKFMNHCTCYRGARKVHDEL